MTLGYETTSDQDGKDVIIFMEPSEATRPSPKSSSAGPASPSGAGEDDARQAAFNPETGEINWDCPCLGGMAKPPCGETFKEAFSCFVFSTTEPKGMDCIEKFQAMQQCFKAYPDIYGNEIDDDDDEDEKGHGDGGAKKETDQKEPNVSSSSNKKDSKQK